MTDSILNELPFTLTGSRYWNKINPVKVPITPETDYDYVAEYSKELVDKFIERGYVTRTGNKPKTISPIPGANRDYEDYSTILVLYKGTTQLIFKKNVRAYLTLMEKVGVDFYRNFLWKKYTPVPQIQKTLNFLLQYETPPQ